MASDEDRQKIDELATRVRQAQEAASGTSAEKAAKGSNAGYEMAGTIVGSILIGWLVDQYFHTSPWGVLGMLMVGIAASFFNVWRSLNGYDQSVGLNKTGANKGKGDGR